MRRRSGYFNSGNIYEIVKGKVMRKTVSFILSIISAFSAAPFAVYSAEPGEACGDNLNWSFDASTGRLTLSGTGNMYDYNDDASPAPWMNNYKTQIKSVVCESGVTSVGSKAFMGCTSLTSVDFGPTMKGIGWYAFYGCTALTGVAIPDTITGVWSGCFQNCTGITWVNLGAGLSDLAPYMFAGCSNSSFWWVSIPANVKTIGEHAFDGCSGLGYNTVAGTGIDFGTDCFKNIKSDATFVIADADSRIYLSAYWSGWSFKCVDDRHTFGSPQVTAPTCIEDGYTTYNCSVCLAVFNDDYVDALGHSYDLVSESLNDYLYSYVCSRCGHAQNISALTLQNEFLEHINEQKDAGSFKYELDVNGDGYINIRDYSIICRKVNMVNSADHATSVDTSSAHQTMLGFGASAAWWSQCIGGWSEDEVNNIMRLLYDKDEGIGLNIYRYNLGAGSKSDGALPAERSAECFLQSDGTYDWTADENARKCLAAANSYCSNMRVTLFSNSAPVYYTVNGRAYGEYIPDGSSYKTNLSSSNYSKHADFVIKCAEHFTQEGYRVTDISPINEPEWAWGAYDSNYNSAGQEGCHFDKTECRDFYKACITAVNSSSVKDTCEIEMWESGKMGGSGTTFDAYLEVMLGTALKYRIYNSALRNYFTTISFHSYWVNQSDRESTAQLLGDSAYSGYKRSVTEYCQMDGSSSGLGMEYGLDLADTIYQDLTILDVQEWDWWTAVAGGGYMDGLLYVDYTNSSSSRNVQTSKRFWVMGNFAKFTGEGSVRIDASCTDDMKVCGFRNTDGTITLVYINQTENDNYTYFDSSAFSSFSAYVTDSERDLICTQENIEASVPAEIPANSVTTVVLNQ